MKTKLTKLIALLLAILMLTSLCACGANDSTPTTDDNSSTSGTQDDSTSGTEGNNPTGTTNGNNGTTSNDPVPPLYENKDKGISAIYHYQTDVLVAGIEKSLTRYSHLKTNGKYCDGWGNELELVSEPVKFFNNGERMAYWAADGKYYVHTANGHIAFDVPNDDSLVAYYYAEGDGYYFYNLKNGYLYLSVYNIDGSSRESIQNRRLYLSTGVNEISEQKITAYLFDGHSVVLWLEDGNCYYSPGHYLGSDTYNDERIMAIAVSNRIGNLDKVYDCISFDRNRYTPKSPIYSKVGDNANLYLMYYNGSEDEYELKIKLPEGFTTADLKQVHLEHHLFVEFKDGSVYVLDEENINVTTSNATMLTLTCHEGLSELGRAGHIRAILNYDLGSRAVVLLDDGCMYRVDAK